VNAASVQYNVPTSTSTPPAVTVITGHEGSIKRWDLRVAAVDVFEGHAIIDAKGGLQGRLAPKTVKPVGGRCSWVVVCGCVI